MSEISPEHVTLAEELHIDPEEVVDELLDFHLWEREGSPVWEKSSHANTRGVPIPVGRLAMNASARSGAEVERGADGSVLGLPIRYEKPIY